MSENEKKVIFTPKIEEEGRIDEFPTINPEELQSPKLATVPVDTEELEVEEKIMEGVEEELEKAIAEEDLNKKNYVKITPTFYIQSVKGEKDDENLELFKIFNPETGLVEKRELTDEEKHEILVQELKESRIKFHRTKHPTRTIGMITKTNSVGKPRKIKEKAIATNIIVNKFDTKFKQKRKRKNKLTKTSRKANRK